MKPLISVVIANYNYGHFLAETIASALAQTYSPVEIIFIDDGSTDDSLAIARRYPITVLAQHNQGVSAARNNGAQYARGEYVLFLDSDDLLYPDSLAVLQQRLEAAGPSAGFAYGQLQYFGEKDTVFASHPFDPRALSRENYIQTSALIRLQAFRSVGGFDRGFDLREDWELFIRLWHGGWSGAFLPRPVIKYRKHRPKAVVRAQGKLRKQLSDAKLITLYPRFFWRKLAAHPLRYVIHRTRWKVRRLVGQHGPTGPATLVQSPHPRHP
jgi:glycosyltransferase involved in cell wall biosynthesis